MTTYKPDNWITVKVNDEGLYKILAGWSGGYLYGDSWKLNSGITKVDEYPDYYDVHGSSGSIYQCFKDREFSRMNIENIRRKMINDFSVEEIKLDDLKNKVEWKIIS